jgi:drug/metabolite transporter (DMT)-like permease
MWFWLQLLSVCAWAALNVLDSILVRHYEKHPLVLGWNQSCFSMFVLILLAAFTGIAPNEWTLTLLFFGMIGFIGDIVFWRALDLIDVSITNIAWAILSLFLSIGGFIMFQETWSLMQTIGAVLMIAGVVFLSVWQRKITSIRSLLLLPALALLYTPFYLTQKVALLNGQTAFAVFFWMILGREAMFFVVPWFIPSIRRRLVRSIPRAAMPFYALNGTVICLFLTAIYLTSQAYDHGPVSLVSMVGNIQPFLVLIFAWIAAKLFPRTASREVLTLQSVRVKIVSFLIVFSGLALLAIHQ